MKSMYGKIAIVLLSIGLLSASGSQTTSTPTSASQPTEAVVPATQAPATEPAQAATVSFANDVLPIIQSRCINCHGGDRTEKA